MADSAVPLEIAGLNEWDVDGLERALDKAGLPAGDVAIKTKAPTSDDTRVFEPGTIALAIAIAKYAVPAVAAVIITWLKTRSATKPITLTIEGAPVSIGELETRLKGWKSP